ncbi:MAG: ribonuclease J, partial [Chloroflexaceae bacterium]|nr:ribonuclease J [Chloroflexaceae bacterium]
MTTDKLRLLPLGGAGEVGRNMWVLEYADEILILELWRDVPRSDMLGVDLVLPDITY